MITYDRRICMKKSMCANSRLISVHEAITLITLSLIYPEKLENKPTVYGLTSEINSSKEIEIDYNQPLTFSFLESILFKVIFYFSIYDKTYNYSILILMFFFRHLIIRMVQTQ